MALPLVMAGIARAAVAVVATATLAAYVGFGGSRAASSSTACRRTTTPGVRGRAPRRGVRARCRTLRSHSCSASSPPVACGSPTCRSCTPDLAPEYEDAAGRIDARRSRPARLHRKGNTSGETHETGSGAGLWAPCSSGSLDRRRVGDVDDGGSSSGGDNPPDLGSLTIGSKDFVGCQILGQVYGQAFERSATTCPTRRTSGPLETIVPVARGRRDRPVPRVPGDVPLLQGGRAHR